MVMRRSGLGRARSRRGRAWGASLALASATCLGSLGALAAAGALVSRGARAEAEPRGVGGAEGAGARVAPLPGGGTSGERAPGPADEHASPASRAEPADPEARLREGAPLGEPAELYGRVAGTTARTGGVRLAQHDVRVRVRGGVARTELRLVMANDTPGVLEGTTTLAVPGRAALSRLALFVGDTLMEAEMVERSRAVDVFTQIVEDTARPRDPALLSWARGATHTLSIFPVFARSSREVLLAWEELLPRRRGRFVYRYPLASLPEATRFSFALEGDGAPLTGVTDLSSHAAAREATGDLVLSFDAPAKSDAVWHVPTPGEAASGPRGALRAPEPGEPEEPGGLVALRLEAPALARAPGRRELVLVVDVSAAQSAASITAARREVSDLVATLGEGERFAVLACDSACVSAPERGLFTVGADVAGRAPLDALDALFGSLEAEGARVVEGALSAAAARVERPADTTLVWLGAGLPTAGERSPARVAARLAPALRGVDVHLAGHGPRFDAFAMHTLAVGLGASESAPDAGEPLATAVERARLFDVRLTLPPGLVEPSPMAGLRAGDELVVLARALPGFVGGVARLEARAAGRERPIEVTRSLEPEASSSPALPRLFARERLARLELSGEARAQAVRLSRDAHVLGRTTSLLALEDDRMYAEHGIERRAPKQASASSLGPRPSVSSVTPMPPARARPSLGLGMHGAQGSARSGKTSLPRVRMGATRVTGRLPPESVARVVQAHRARFRACYERGLARDPSLEGRVAVRFTIRRDGRVESAQAATRLAGGDDVTQCITRAFVGMQFPEPPEGGVVDVLYPFVLTSDGTRPSRPVALPPMLPVPAPLPPLFEPWSSASFARVELRPGHERWRAEGPLLAEARAIRAAALYPEGTAGPEGLARALVASGRFDEARAELGALSRRHPSELRLIALEAPLFLAVGEPLRHARRLETRAALAPDDERARLDAAAALEAAGEPTRACAHRRALGRSCSWLSRAVERVFVDARPALTLEVRCEGPGPCPTALVVTPRGEVATSLAALYDGRFRVVLVGGGGARGVVDVRALGARRAFAFEGAGALTTVAEAVVSGLDP